MPSNGIIVQRAKLLADHFPALLEQDIIPSPLLGTEKTLHYSSDRGSCATNMISMIKRQDKEKTNVVVSLFHEQQIKEKSYADYYEKSIHDLYNKRNNLIAYQMLKYS